MCTDNTVGQFTQLFLTMETDYLFLTMETLSITDDVDIVSRQWKHLFPTETLSFTDDVEIIFSDDGDRLIIFS